LTKAKCIFSKAPENGTAVPMMKELDYLIRSLVFRLREGI